MPTETTEVGFLKADEFRLSAEKRDANEERTSVNVPSALRLPEPCFICGRVLKLDDPSAVWEGWWVRLGSYGDHIVPTSFDFNTIPQPERDRGWDLGHFPLGSECAKKVPLAYRRKLVG